MVIGQVCQLEVRQMGEESWNVSSLHYLFGPILPMAIRMYLAAPGYG